MSIHEINVFCRKFDLIYVETGRVEGQDVYWFLNHQNQRVFYTAPEIYSKIQD